MTLLKKLKKILICKILVRPEKAGRAIPFKRSSLNSYENKY
ncbi:hypothetical protein SAMN04488130_106104 [Flavobacterium urumqiense]|uniref:Uncharacterized protein n=1 Tax=Flavobacterium urumqiense TaxID=935224 RepID=A0A1H5XNA3_9FLAO|nr:hypothetical protein SAMN04488130_106104 [Flavobacterium urumqiense]